MGSPEPQVRIRRNVHALGSDWADPVLWYARGIRAMRERDLSSPTSWNFYAAIHGIWRDLWDFYGYTSPADPDPSQADIDTYWEQCQHGSFHFLPWHRGYLLALESILRHEIGLMNGPADDWALPYWNYFLPGQEGLPPAFASPDWPDGTGDNPLFVEQRWGPFNDGDVTVPPGLVNLAAMGDPVFTGTGNGGSTGFGGIDTGFAHGGAVHGGVESQPHDLMHVIIGGRNPTQTDAAGRPLPGLMTTPPAAALDPIFWLHHANIDRLWESWNFHPPGKPAPVAGAWQNPTGSRWLDGPASIGEREFAMPRPDGTKWVYTPAEMQDIRALGYDYDDLEPAGTVAVPETPPPAEREAIRMVAQRDVELIGSNDRAVPLAGPERVHVRVPTEPEARARTEAALRAEGPAAPGRVFLNLENIRTQSDAAVFQVYVGLPPGTAPDERGAHLAGSIALFGATEASGGGPARDGGDGVTYVLEITGILGRMQTEGPADLAQLPVDLVPVGEIPAAAEVTIGRISIYRQDE